MAKNKLKNIVYSVLFLGVVGGLFAWPIMTDPNRPLVKTWNAADVNCIAGHSAIAGGGQHIHQTLTISVNGAPETLVGDMGVVRGCMAEIHVHKGTDNYLHSESIDATKKFKLEQFFAVYGTPLVRDGYTLEAIVNGATVADPANLVLEDKQLIDLKYTSITQ